MQKTAKKINVSRTVYKTPPKNKLHDGETQNVKDTRGIYMVKPHIQFPVGISRFFFRNTINLNKKIHYMLKRLKMSKTWTL